MALAAAARGGEALVLWGRDGAHRCRAPAAEECGAAAVKGVRRRGGRTSREPMDSVNEFARAMSALDPTAVPRPRR